MLYIRCSEPNKITRKNYISDVKQRLHAFLHGWIYLLITDFEQLAKLGVVARKDYNGDMNNVLSR